MQALTKKAKDRVGERHYRFQSQGVTYQVGWFSSKQAASDALNTKLKEVLGDY